MRTIQQDIDDLDRMIDGGNASKDEIRSQIRLISREVTALEADYANLAAQQPASQSDLEYQRGLYYKAGDSIPFCPYCWEASNKKIHLFGPIPMSDSSIEYWECHTCDKDYDAKAGQNFLAAPARPGRRHH